VKIRGGYINNELSPSFLSNNIYFTFLLNMKSEVSSRTCAGCSSLPSLEFLVLIHKY